MKKKKILILSTVLATGLCIGGVVVSNDTFNLLNKGEATDNIRRGFTASDRSKIVFDGTTGTLTDGSATYTFTNCQNAGDLVTLNDGGTITKDEARGLDNICVSFTGGSLTLRTGFTADDLCFSYDLTSGQIENIRGNYFVITATGEVNVESIGIEYNCLVSEEESHNYSTYHSDNDTHWQTCGDDHCTKTTTPSYHSYVASGLGTSFSDTTGTIKLNCNTCGTEEKSFDYVRSGTGWTAFGSDRSSTQYNAYGSACNGYSHIARRQTDVKVLDHWAPLFKIGTYGGTDGTETGASFRFMTGFSTTTTSKGYIYYVKNCGTQTLTFDIYGRSGGTDKSAVDAYTVSLAPGESDRVKVVYNQNGNINILSYFRFHDCNPVDGLLAIGLEVSDNVTSTVTFTDAQFDDDTYSREFIIGSKITGLKDTNIVGAKDSNNNYYALDTYTVGGKDVTFSKVEKEATVITGTGLLDYAKGASSTDTGSYGTNSISKLGHTYVGNEYATLFSVKGVEGETTGEGCGNNASFRTLTSYTASGGVEVKYTITNTGSAAASFDIYERNSGSETAASRPIESVLVDVGVGETVTANVFFVGSGSNNNLLTYFKAQSDFVTTLAIRAEVVKVGVRIGLAGGPTFDDDTTKGVFASNETLSVKNIPSYDGYTHIGWANTDTSIYANTTTLTAKSSAIVEPYYDCEYASTFGDTYGKYSFGSVHPNTAARRGSFASKNVTLSNGVITGTDMAEYATKFTYTDAITAGSTFLSYNSQFNVSAGSTSIKVTVQNLSSSNTTFDLYQIQTSGSAFPADHKIGTVQVEANTTTTLEFTYSMHSHDTLMIGWSFPEALSGLNVLLTMYGKK